MLPPFYFSDQLAIRVVHIDGEIHFPYGMGRAGQAGIVAADCHFHAIENLFVRLGDEMLCSLPDRLVDCRIVLLCGHDEIGLLDPSLLVAFIFVNKDASRGFHNSHACAGLLGHRRS